MVVAWSLKQRKNFIETDLEFSVYDRQYNALYDGLTIFDNSIMEYYMLFLLRRIYFVCIAYYLEGDEHVAL